MGFLLRNWFAAFALLLTLGWAVPAAAEPEGPYYIAGSDVNLRSAPSGDVIQKLDGGEKLYVIERDGVWCHVSLPTLDVQGWVYGDYVAKTVEAAASRPDGGKLPSPQNGAQAEGDVAEIPLSSFTEATD